MHPRGARKGFITEYMRKKRQLITGQVYHILNKSIAGFKVFNSEDDYARMLNLIRFYQLEKMPCRFSRFLELKNVQEEGFHNYFISVSQGRNKLVQIIAYCIMPTHFHLLLKQKEENGISVFMGNVLNSYVRYFNQKYKRKGPLWESAFKDVIVKMDEQLFHLTRYIHLNPITAYLVDKPENWPMSSYREYLSEVNEENKFCEYRDILTIEPALYKNFVEDRIAGQRELAKIKKLSLET